MEMGTLIGYGLTALGAGGIGEVIRQIRESRARRDEVSNSHAEIELERDKYEDSRLQRIIDNLVSDNESLRERHALALARADAADALAQERLEQMRVMEAELVEVRRKVDVLQQQLHELLEAASEATRDLGSP